MNKKALIGMLLAVVANSAPQNRDVHWGEGRNGFSVGLRVENATYKIDEPIWVTVFLRNDGGERGLTVWPPRLLIGFICTDEKRRRIAERPFNPDSISGMKGFPVPTGYAHEERVDLREYLALSNGGNFVLTAVRRFPGQDPEVLSGNVIINIAGSVSQSTGVSMMPMEMASSSNSPKLAPAVSSNADNAAGQSAARWRPSPTLEIPVVTGARVTPAFRVTVMQSIGLGMIVVLLVALLGILWRAARRKTNL